MALPSGYEYADLLWRNNLETTSPYFDLGVVASSDVGLNILFNIEVGNNRSYVFGARETASTSSAKQLNLFWGGEDTSYLGYAGTRHSLGTKMYMRGGKSLQKDANIFTINSANQEIIETTGATTTFTGTKNMFLFALNNAGSPSFGSAPNYGDLSFACVQLSFSGEMTMDLIPVYDIENERQCIYNRVDGTIITESGSGSWSYLDASHYLLTIESDEGGYAYAYTKGGIETTKLYCHSNYEYSLSEQNPSWYETELVAYEKNGYVFIGWEKDGQIVSVERRISVLLSEDTVFRAKFVKKTEDGKNPCILMCYKYGEDVSQATINDCLAYTLVESASINVDGLAKTTSTIKVKEVPDGVMVNSAVVLKNPRGKILYCGVIKAIEDKVLTCREMISLFDSDFLFLSTRNTTKSIMYSLATYLESFFYGYPSTNNVAAQKNASIVRFMNLTPFFQYSAALSVDPSLNMNITAPVIDSATVKSLEDHLLDAFNDFGIYVETSILNFGAPYLYLLISNPRIQTALTVSDNSEAVTDVTVDVQETENTSLVVFDSTGATFRGIYSVKLDGTITNYNYPVADEESFIAYNSCKPKIVMTDDAINTVLEQYLSNAKYNHKITFNLDLNSSLYSLDAFNIGRRVQFYYKDKMYSSIVTGLSWDLPENTEDPHSVKVILGKVRTKLTIKLNLGKTGKKK